MKNKIQILAMFFIAVFIAFSCSKDDEPDVRDFETISFDREVVLEKLPDGLKNSQDPYAQQAVGYVESALNWSDFSSQLDPPENAVKVGKKKGDTYTWTWNYGSQYILTLWWTYSDDADKNYWEIDIQYGDGERSDYINAWENKDDSGGEVLYNYAWVCAMDEPSSECENLYWVYNWNRDENDNFLFTYSIEAEDDEFESSMNYETFVNDDGSGSVDYYFYGEHFYHMEWDSDGNGSWVQYLGESEITGSWSVDS